MMSKQSPLVGPVSRRGDLFLDIETGARTPEPDRESMPSHALLGMRLAYILLI